MSHLDTQLGYSTGEFQALQLIVLVALPVCYNIVCPLFWKSTFKQQFDCWFDTLDCKSSFFFVF